MEPIAIIGMSGRFPHADNPEAFWDLLRTGGNAIDEVPSDRWDADAVYSPSPEPGKMCTRWGGFLNRVSEFDAPFFGISAREARYMDPQQRVILEVGWEALERAGIAPTSLGGSKTGVFIGISNYDYNRLLCKTAETMDAFSSTGTILAITANRLSYLLNLRGPSLVVDTACSSSLVSVHLACQSLRYGESDLALAGGVNLILSPEVTIILSQSGLMSPDGRCKTFDEAANGYVRSEGCGMLVLRRLSDARRDGNNILALIRGSAVNQDGSTNGLTAPSASAQEDVIQTALAAAETTPDELSYVEAHGSGTRLGDIIETRALRTVLLKDRSADNLCAIGSVKTNIGHTESAAGIAGLMKVILALRHEVIPANLHLKKLNRYIRFANTPLFVPTEPFPWPAGEAPRLAGVSSFGIGGTNAHVILEEAPKHRPQPSRSRRSFQILPLSAKSEGNLQRMVENYRSFLAANPEIPFADICFTAGRGRSHFSHRFVVACDSTVDGQPQLPIAEFEENGHSRLPTAATQPVAFLLNGRGDEYVGYGARLFQTEPAFQMAIDNCDRLLHGGLEQPLASWLNGDRSAPPGTQEAPLLAFGFQYALAELWRSWGIKPAALLGTGIGELVAACVAGVWTLEQGAKMVTDLATLNQSELTSPHATPSPNRPGRQTESDVSRARPFSFPAENSGRGFLQTLSETVVRVPQIDIISSHSGNSVNEQNLTDPAYWARALCEPPQPAKAFESLNRRGICIFLELGHTSAFGKDPAQSLPEDSYYLGSLSHSRGCEETIETLKELYLLGIDIDWSVFYRDSLRQPVLLPTYPFEPIRFWYDSDSETPRSLKCVTRS